MKGMKFIILFAFSLILASCENETATRVEGTKFSLELNNDWKHITGQGFDTFVGRFSDGVEEIIYDYGYFAGVNLDAVQQTPETTYYEETIIDGAHAKIVKKNKEGVQILTLYIWKDDGDKGKVWIVNPSQDEFFISVFRSFRFL